MMQRRAFLATPAAALAQAGEPQYVKSICNAIFAPGTPLAEQFQQARNAGFRGIEVRMGGELTPDTSKAAAERVGDAARKAGVAIASVWVSGALAGTPLNHSDPATRTRGTETIHKAIDVCRNIGCGAMLIVPGRLGDGAHFRYGYRETWDRVSAELAKCIGHAAEAKVCLTPENVWNKFLVSPLEMKAFVDQFESPWLQTHFDIGNVMQFGYPQDWILTLGPRIKRVHVKDYKLSDRFEQGRFVDLLEGDVDWKEVMAALKQAGYRGFLSPEMGYRKDDPDYLMKVSKALDRILAMA